MRQLKISKSITNRDTASLDRFLADIGKEQKLFDDCMKYSPYMRKRLTLLRLGGMIGK